MRILAKATGPNKLWLIAAADRGFTGRRGEVEDCLLEAIAWVAANSSQ